MGALAAIKQLASSLLVFAYALAAFFSRRGGLHSARFARTDELAALFTTVLDHEASRPANAQTPRAWKPPCRCANQRRQRPSRNLTASYLAPLSGGQ
jgi:hypothetical protein